MRVEPYPAPIPLTEDQRKLMKGRGKIKGMDGKTAEQNKNDIMNRRPERHIKNATERQRGKIGDYALGLGMERPDITSGEWENFWGLTHYHDTVQKYKLKGDEQDWFADIVLAKGTSKTIHDEIRDKNPAYRGLIGLALTEWRDKDKTEGNT